MARGRSFFGGRSLSSGNNLIWTHKPPRSFRYTKRITWNWSTGRPQYRMGIIKK